MIELLSRFCEGSLRKENLDGKLPQDLVVSKSLQQIMIDCFDDEELFLKPRKSTSTDNENDGDI
jgi:hypothetical protein